MSDDTIIDIITTKENISNLKNSPIDEYLIHLIVFLVNLDYMKII